MSERHKTRYPGLYFRLNAKGERRYQISYIDSNKNRVFKTVEGNEKDALRERAKILERMHRGERVVRSRMTVKDLGEDWHRTQLGQLRESTKDSYGYALDRWVYPRIGSRQISQVDVNVIADLIAELNQTYSGATVRNCLKPLSRMFAYAKRRGWVSSNPVSELDRSEMPKGSPKRMRILDTEEINRLLKVKTVYRTMFMTAIFAGLRRGELLALTWDDIDLANGIIRVREGKTEAAARDVRIPQFLTKALAEEMKTEGPVFPFKKRNVNRALEAALTRAKVEHARFHDLRHTFVSILISQGEDGAYIARQAGHRSPATTYGVYGHLLDRHKREDIAMKRMQESFEEVVG